MKTLKTICEGVLSDINVSLDTMDGDLIDAVSKTAFNKTPKNFEETVKAFADYFKLKTPKIKKDTVNWKGATYPYKDNHIGRFIPNTKVAKLKLCKIEGTLQTVTNIRFAEDPSDGSTYIQCVNATKPDIKFNPKQRYSHNGGIVNYRYDCSLMEFLNPKTRTESFYIYAAFDTPGGFFDEVIK